MIDEIRIARRWVEQRPVFLDAETTGLGEDAQACEIAVVDHDGAVLMNTLVRPIGFTIPVSASAIHGITNAMVFDAPRFSDIRGELYRVLHGRLCVAYNSEFDMRILMQSSIASGCRMALTETECVCAMLLYSDYRGEWSDYHRGNRWFKLEMACALEHIPTLGIEAHRAAGDAELTRRLVMAMASRLMPWEPRTAQTKPLMTKGASV